jgi:hypothetical protein
MDLEHWLHWLHLEPTHLEAWQVGVSDVVGGDLEVSASPTTFYTVRPEVLQSSTE